MEDQELRALIQSEIRSGRLPRCAKQHHLFGGRGEGAPCVCCGQMIYAGSVQFEVECVGSAFLMHMHCYDEWCKACEVTRPGSHAA